LRAKGWAIGGVLLLAILVFGALGWGAAITVGPGGLPTYDYATIQAAIIAASTGDTVNVAAGTYDEQVVIDKALTLQGVGDTTIIQPTQATVNGFQLFSRRIPGHAQGDGPTAAIVVVSDVSSGSATIKDIKIDALNVVTNTSGATKFVEMLCTGSNATIDGVTFLGNDDWPDDSLYLTPWDEPAVTVEIKNCDFSHFWFNAITANFAGLTANIHHNTITGRGEVTDSAGNGIQYGWGCTGTASYNTISDLAYISESVYVDAGIQFWCTNATASHNTITDCQTGVLVQADEVGTFAVTVENNTISAPGLSADVPDIEGINVSANANNPSITATIQGNDLSGGGLGDGIGIGLTEGGDSPDVTADINGNETSNWNNGIWLGLSTKTVNITGNTITDNDANGIDVLTGVDVSDVSAHYNKIVGNTDYGVENGGTGTLDAEANYWGDALDGPTHTSNPNGTGDEISDNVTYEPWLYFTTAANGGDTAVNIVANEVPAYAFPRDLSAGWNTFSTPIGLDGQYNTWAELYDLTNLDYSMAYRFDTASQTFVALATTTEYAIAPGEGFYIKMNSADSIPYCTSTLFSMPSRDLKEGWDMLGGGMDTRTEVDSCVSIATSGSTAGYTHIISPWENAGDPWVYIAGAASSEGDFVASEGYWVFMAGDRALWLFDHTPAIWIAP